MSSKESRRGDNIVIGGSVTGSVIGNKNQGITITTAGETSSASLDDLRAAIALLRAEIKAVGGSEPASAEKVWTELDKFEEELGAENLDGEMVAIRWKLVQRLLVPLQHMANIAQIADRILTHTRSLFGGN